MRSDIPVQVKLADYQPYPFSIETVDLTFDLKPAATRVRAKLQVRRDAAGDMVLDGIGLTLNTITIDGAPVAADQMVMTKETLTLKSVPDAFVLETDVTIDPSANTALSGLYISGERFCTQCESEGFRHITYWPDRPDVMSRFTVRVEANKASYPILLSNGTPGGTGDLPDGRHFAEWDDPHLKPSYLFALCAGDYDIYRDQFTTMSGQHVDLGIHVDKGDAQRAAWAMESLKASMRWDEEVFAREYDLGVFNIVAVRDFNFGAMENKGLNVFNSAYVLANDATATDADFEAIESIVGHEYFHNWTGNRITCRDWFQLCLKEGLTVFRDQEFSADLRSRPVQRIKDVIRLRGRQFAEDAGPLAHMVRPNAYGSIDNLYTATVYEKGAELIRMLKTLIGEDAFARGMQLYFNRHDGEATTIEVFYTCFEDASGQDLTAFRQWYHQPGTPTVKVTEDWDETAQKLSVTLTQTNPTTPGNTSPTPLPMPLKVAAFSRSGDKLVDETLVISGETLNWQVSASERPLLSINREFSAPIILNDGKSQADRLDLARIDDDPFNRWDAFQTLATENLIGAAYSGQKVDTDFVMALADAIRKDAVSDPAFASLLARLPTVSDLFLKHAPADPVALQTARDTLQKALGETLMSDATKLLSEPSPTPFKPDATQAGTRALRSAMIALLAATKTAEAAAQLKSIFDSAPNMTESLSALRGLCQMKTSETATAIAAFETRWKDNPLVMDKWFAVQAGAASASEVAELLDHPDFDFGNPNRVRSVVAVFAVQNLSGFHAPDGAGHRFVADAIKQADTRNPALAARLSMSFEQWRSLEGQAKASAEKILQDLQKSDLSKNVTDIVIRAIGAPDS